MSFKEVLSDITNESTTGRGWVYLPTDKNWNLNSNCVILESEEVPPELEDNPDAGVPQFAKKNDLMQVLPVSIVQQVVANAREQNSDATLQDFFKAFIFYYKHDAFINLKDVSFENL